MRPTTLSKIAEVIGAEILGSGNLSAQVTAVNTDSRTVAPGQCFLAIPGKNFDGHDYIPAALA
ncbi:MAG: UDP-N-acetylmuramoyl-tripeptide--D-alanyl-D-alanine ligase, partial [Phycisphaerae bacterium]|nr:UDP-N-acetylmuramoyl-tripeptide--D-alanyl-D-alanine ligase [Phycisphaerae bacterium]